MELLPLTLNEYIRHMVTVVILQSWETVRTVRVFFNYDEIWSELKPHGQMWSLGFDAMRTERTILQSWLIIKTKPLQFIIYQLTLKKIKKNSTDEQM